MLCLAKLLRALAGEHSSEMRWDTARTTPRVRPLLPAAHAGVGGPLVWASLRACLKSEISTHFRPAESESATLPTPRGFVCTSPFVKGQLGQRG